MPDNAARAAIFVLLVMPGTLLVDDVELIEKGGGAGGRPELEDKKLRHWLDRNAIPVATLQLKGDMRDLAPLARRLQGVRVVQLGENTHGDGLVFAAKARLVRWLHERMGFDVIAFESGMFECERANRMLRPGADPKEVMRASVFGIWHPSARCTLFEYLIEQSGTRSPMAITGFDLRKAGGAANELIPDALALLKAAGIEAARNPTAETVLALVRENRDRLVAKHGERDVAFYEYVLAMRMVEPTFEKMQGKERLNFRDRWMGRASSGSRPSAIPRPKIVCWAATAHQAHGLEHVRNDKGPMYEGLTMAGEYAHKALGRKLYTIGFVSHGGWAGLWTMKNFKVPAPRAGSVEDLLYRYGTSPLIVPLRGGSPFRESMLMAPMSYGTRHPRPVAQGARRRVLLRRDGTGPTHGAVGSLRPRSEPRGPALRGSGLGLGPSRRIQRSGTSRSP